MLEKDSYDTILNPSKEVLFKDRGSKFFGYAFPIQDESQVKESIQILKATHHKARHFCYAWQIGVDRIQFRVNDDGEPTNSAGQPIYGQILSKQLSNILVVVVRYFGGTKLGVGGLVNAYKNTAQLALESATIVKKIVEIRFKLVFDYPYIDKVMRVIKEKELRLVSQKMELHCELEIAVRKKNANQIEALFKEMHKIKIVKL